MNQSEKKDDDEFFEPFSGLDKGILQEKRIFSESPLHPRKCYHLITKILHLFTQGEEFTSKEAEDLFFSITLLFQSQDVPLRRMVYLVLKMLVPLVEDSIIVISCLTKDMKADQPDLYRANAIRVLCKINDIPMLLQAERLLKQAIVDKEPYVASAALLSGVHLLKASGIDIVKRWFSEIQSAVKSRFVMVQYHAMGLLHHIKRHDRLAVSRLVSELIRTPIRSNYAHCLLIKYTCQVLDQEDDESEKERFYDYLESCLRHKSSMTAYEAARGICELENVSSKKLSPAITTLQTFLGSCQPTLRFAALRTLNKVAMTHPLSVTSCNLDMENLISDPNRSIATLAITTLLKTGSEVSVDRLMKQISTFMNEITDEFKIVVVDAIKSLCLKFKNKHRSLMNFLANMLRDEGGFFYKKAIVDTLLVIIESLPDAKEVGLSHLCEFIEDCEFTQLSTTILNLLGKEGPTTSCPSKYIRYIYNRVILENANVRASAVSALAKFGIALADLRPRIVILLKRCLHDNDDEVRDRATFYLSLVQNNEEMAKQLIVDDILPFPLVNLEKSLREYQKNPSSEPFNIMDVKRDVVRPATTKQKLEDVAVSFKLPSEFDIYGPVFKSSKPVELTESGTEYSVNCVKHIFGEHIVFQFSITNTLSDQQLEHAVVKLDSDALIVESAIEAEVLPFQVPGNAYVVTTLQPGSFAARVACNLKFMVRDVDPTTGEVEDMSYEDEYPLEDLDVSLNDFMKRFFISNFPEEWDTLGDSCEAVEKFSLANVTNLKDAVTQIVGFLGMQPCEQSEQVKETKKRHQLFLSGTFLGNVSVLARVRMRLAEGGKGVMMQLAVRSTDAMVSQIVASSV